mgnify:CR=1 FL=1
MTSEGASVLIPVGEKWVPELLYPLFSIIPSISDIFGGAVFRNLSMVFV